MWFALTEAVSTTLIVHLCDVRKHVLPWKLLPIICIALTHLKVASFDQLLYQLFMERGKTYRKTRNFGSYIVKHYCHMSHIDLYLYIFLIYLFHFIKQYCN